MDDLTRYLRGTVYACDSKLRIFGLPLLSVRFGFARHRKFTWDHVAKGVSAVGAYAGGVVAAGKTAIGQEASGTHVLLWGGGLTDPQVRPFLPVEHHPGLWRPLLDVLTAVGTHIK